MDLQSIMLSEKKSEKDNCMISLMWDIKNIRLNRMAEGWREEDEGKQDQIVMERDLTWDGEHTIE